MLSQSSACILEAPEPTMDRLHAWLSTRILNIFATICTL